MLRLCKAASACNFGDPPHRHVQIGVCYQLAFNTVSYELLCQARTRVNFIIGQWQRAHHLMHSQSVQPGFTMRGDKGVTLHPMSESDQGAAPASALAAADLEKAVVEHDRRGSGSQRRVSGTGAGTRSSEDTHRSGQHV